MVKRLFALFCALALLAAALPAAAETDGVRYSYDFDLTFTLDADAFPPLLRSRAAGYEALLSRIGLRGNLAWSTKTASMEMDAVLYYRDKPSLAFPFRLYGCEQRLFFTSPSLADEVVLLNMPALLEFAIKAKNNMGVPMPYLAYLYPYVTQTAFSRMSADWQSAVGRIRKSGYVSVKKLLKASRQWGEELIGDPNLQRWITALAAGSEAPEAIENEFSSLPEYYNLVCGGKRLSVTVGKGSETWKNAAGQELFTRTESGDTFSMRLSLPASENGYVPEMSLSRRIEDQTFFFDFGASLLREDADTAEAGEDDYTASLPACLLSLSAAVSGLPLRLPADAAFSVSGSVLGAAYPNFSFFLQGETTEKGSVTLSLRRPEDGATDPAEIFRCSGTLVPAALRDIPDYQYEDFTSAYNAFSFNEESLADFRGKVLPTLVRSLLSFVEAAPTSACQSILDDLSDIGMLDMLLN